MPISTNEIIALLKNVAEEEGLKVAIKNCLKAAVKAGGGAAIGGMLLGPPGIAVGGCLGSIYAAATSEDFKSVPEILIAMDEERKEILAENIRRIMSDIGVVDITCFAAMLAADATLKNKIIGELADYLKTELSMAIVDHC